MGRKQEHETSVASFQNFGVLSCRLRFLSRLLVVVDLFDGARVGWLLESLLGERRLRSEISVDLGHAVLEVSEEALSYAGVEDGHRVGVGGVEIALDLADAV